VHILWLMCVFVQSDLCVCVCVVYIPISTLLVVLYYSNYKLISLFDLFFWIFIVLRIDESSQDS
jgi:hypothetical protein